MREILFRAKAINRDIGEHRTNYKNGDWVYGLVTRLYDERFKILPAEMTDVNGVSRIEVDYRTIGQYTGLTDKNGKKIFGGDILKTDNGKRSAISAVEYGDFEPKLFYDLLEVYVMPRPKEKIHGLYAKTTNGEEMFLANAAEHIEVIGNIHDNPEQFGIVEQLKGE